MKHENGVKDLRQDAEKGHEVKGPIDKFLFLFLQGLLLVLDEKAQLNPITWIKQG